MADDAPRTEQPTQRRRREARRQGHVARSGELVASGQMLTIAVLLSMAGVSLVRSMGTLLREQLSQAHDPDFSITIASDLINQIGRWGTSSVLPWLLAIGLAAVALNLVQVGFLLHPGGIAPDIARLNPARGLGRILSAGGGARLGFSLTKIAVLLGTGAWFISRHASGLARLSQAPLNAGFIAVIDAVSALAMTLATTLVVVGIADYGWQRWKFERSLRMTQEEVRRELRESEGDAQLRRHRRQVQQATVESTPEPLRAA